MFTIRVIAGLLGLSVSACISTDFLPAKQVHEGREIFFGREEVVENSFALVSASDVPVPIRAVPCSGCHSLERKQVVAQGVTVPVLSASALLTGLEVAAPDRRARPAYDLESFARVVRTGVDSGQNRLDPQMPRFPFSDDQINSLWQFILSDEAVSTVRE